MEKNLDPRAVTMHREVFEQLLRLAEIGASEFGDQYNLNEVKRHLRRFNLEIAKEHRVEKEAEEAIFQQNKKRAQNLVRNYSGKEVYLPATKNVYTPCKVIGPSHIPGHKEWIRVEIVTGGKTHRTSVRASEVVIDLPVDSAFFKTGVWAGKWISPETQHP